MIAHPTNCRHWSVTNTQEKQVTSLFGGKLLCKELITANLDPDDPNADMCDKHCLLDDSKKMAMRQAAEESFPATIIVEGADDKTSKLGTFLAKQHSVGNNAHPKTATKALNLIDEFKNTRTPKPKKPKPPQNNKHNDKDAGKGKGANSLEQTKSWNVSETATSGILQKRSQSSVPSTKLPMEDSNSGAS